MALPVINWAAIEPQGDPRYQGLMDAVRRGIETGYMPANQQADLQKKQLANRSTQMQNQYYPQVTEANIANTQANTGLTNTTAQYYPEDVRSSIALRMAQAKRENKMGDLPFGGFQPSGIAGDMWGLEMVKQQFGENSPQYAAAVQQYNLDLEKTKSQTAYQNVLAGTLPTRMLTPQGRGIVEQSNLQSGAMPTGQPWNQMPYFSGGVGGMGSNSISQAMNVPGNPNQPPQPGIPSQAGMQSPQSGVNGIQPQQLPAPAQELSALYGAKREKDATDLDARKRMRFAENIEKSFQLIDPDALTSYSGAKGQAQLAYEQGLDSAGFNTSEKFKKYQASLIPAITAAAQVRQFLGESIQPSMREELLSLTNPSTWNSSPATAKLKLQQFMKLMENEAQTYSDAVPGNPVAKARAESVRKLTISPEDAKKLENAGIAKRVDPADLTEDNLVATAKKHGISVEEVKKRLGVK